MRGRNGLTLAVLAAAVASYSLLQTMSIPTLPLIEHELDTDQATVAWVLTAFLVSSAVSTPLVGRLGDAFGKRRLLVVSLSLLAVGSLAAAAAPKIEVMILARVLQGFGGGVLPLAFGIARDEMPPARVPGSIGLISSLLAVGSGTGIVVAGPIVDGLGYHALFVLPAILTALAAIAAALVIPESPVRSFQGVSFAPALALSGWLVPLLLGLTKAPIWGWTSTRVLGLFGVTVVMCIAWVQAERRATAPLIDLGLLRFRGVWSTNLVALLTGAALYSSFGLLPQFNQTPRETGYGFSASVTEAGHMMLPGTICSFMLGLVGARIAARIGLRTTIVLGTFAISGALAMAALAHQQAWQLYVVSGLSGVGAGLAFACLSTAVVESVPPSQTGVATGMNANLRTVGGSIGVAVTTTLATAHTLPSGYPLESGYTQGFAVLAGSAGAAALAALLIPDLRGPVEHPAAEGLVDGAGGAMVPAAAERRPQDSDNKPVDAAPPRQPCEDKA